ncbi:MAG: hypothetical protein U0136_10015 [Bdellovibrionota bacterium]
MKKIRLVDIAHGRSGDKGNSANIGLVARTPGDYEILKEHVTATAVKSYFRHFCAGEVTRYELPNIFALNFLLTDTLDGGGTVSLRNDAQGKTLAAALLRMEIEIP